MRTRLNFYYFTNKNASEICFFSFLAFKLNNVFQNRYYKKALFSTFNTFLMF